MSHVTKTSIPLQTQGVSAQFGTTTVASLVVFGYGAWCIVRHIAIQDGMESKVFTLQRLVELG
jgi:hypothetical protein